MKLLPYEIWRDIPGFEGHYQASTMGNIRGITRKVKHSSSKTSKCIVKGKQRPGIVDKLGYYHVGLSINGVCRMLLVHRLIAEAFIPNPDNLPEVNHKDENKQNNNVSNLEWCTRKYNRNYGERNTKVSKKLSIPINQYSLDGTLLKTWPSMREIQRKLGISAGSICGCCSGKRNKACGYIWKYADD